MQDAPLHYDRDGRPLGSHEWAALHADRGYRILAQHHAGGWLCSTVWLGIDHSFGDGPPLIFETMVFAPWDYHADRYCERYATEAQAWHGHRAAVKWMLAEMARPACEVRLLEHDELGQ